MANGLGIAAVRLADSALILRLIVAMMAAAGVVLAPSPPLMAIDLEYSAGPVRREVLAIYDSQSEKQPASTRIHQFAEMPLNWMGLKLVYVDVNGPLPTDFERYRGIVSWFIEPIAAADAYLSWLDVATARGLKLAVFANLAPGHSRASAIVSDRVHRRLGIAVSDDYVSVTHRTKVALLDRTMIGFERPLDKVLPDYQVMRQADPAIAVHLAVENAGRAADGTDPSGPHVLVATGPNGGYASDNYTIAFEPVTDRVQWTLNPFEFLKLSMVHDRFPMPDVTTLSGRRIYFSHIDGDGWNNLTMVERYRQAGLPSAEVIRREAIEPFPDLPVTVGVIAGDVLPELGGNAAGREIAKKLFALPQVEVGSHTFSHPFDWSFFERYDRERERQRLDPAGDLAVPLAERARRALAMLTGFDDRRTRSQYAASLSELPRTYTQQPFDLQQEVGGALAISESLAPPGKRARLYQWSGNCLPFEAAIAAVRAAGARNINGGDSRFDSGYASVFYVPPISRPVGRERQIYAGNSNENTYTNDWTGPFYGFSLLAETIRNTESPRRLKPFNVYYHMYSGEKDASLAALLQNLKLARQMSLTPVAASRYAAMADDFFGVDIVRTGAQSWRIINRGEVQTVRFDQAEGLAVDPLNSTGVLGAVRHGSGALYVSLDAAVPEVTVALKSQRSSPGQEERRTVQLVSSRWLIRAFDRASCDFAFEAEGFGSGEMVFEAPAGQRYEVIASRRAERLTTAQLVADASGILDLNIQADAIEPLQLRFECRD